MFPFFSVFGKILFMESNNGTFFPIAFYIAVQQPFKPLWSRLLLYEHEPSCASFALCFKSLLIPLFPASEEFAPKFPARRYFPSPDLSGLRDPSGRNDTACLGLRVSGTLIPFHQGKVLIDKHKYL